MDPQVTPLPPLPHAAGMARLRLLPGTLVRLGPLALARYARHRLLGGRALPQDAPPPAPPFFTDSAPPAPPPDWFGPVPEPMRGLPALSVPTASSFDIRLVWEAGRLADLPALAASDPDLAEAVVRSFVAANPAFRGPHWACGQEASIRLAHLLAAHQAVGGPMRPGLAALVGLHQARILATLDYAMAQDNNHATSEAAGLWLAGLALGDATAEQQGRALLERAVHRLFLPGGAFAQQSMRYQVVALEMPAMAQAAALRHDRPGLAAPALARLRDGAAWLGRITDPGTGRAWRAGPDDGSRFLGAPLDDLRPTLARAAASFGDWAPPDAPCWLDAQGGFAGLSAGSLRAYLRLPVQRFRPGQADALHLELWDGGTCLLGDPGTALYNFNADTAAPDLARTAAHNTVAFDDDDQMPRLGRFLYGGWLRPAGLAAEPGRLVAAYRDGNGRFHRREVRLAPGGFVVEDRFEGRFARATARYRLPEAPWRIEANLLAGGPFSIAIEGTAALALARLPFAPRYGAWDSQPVLEVTAHAPGRLAATITVARAAQSA